jgi:cytochrome c oxidase cbb3-type subunit 3
MSDFTSDIWNFYVIGIVVAGLIACIVLLWSNGSVTFTAGKTTGHSWDEDLEEYNNPLPKWWSLLFFITVIFAVGYLVYFPGLGKFPGIGKWTSANGANSQYAQEVKNSKLQTTLAGYLSQDIQSLSVNPQAMETGKRLFQSYCIQCHGADAKGKTGYPNLTDNDWLYGGAPEQIKESIANGRMGVMTPHAELLDVGQIKAIAQYVLSLSGSGNFDAALTATGRDAFFASDCTTCHGTDAKGNQLLGGPNLTDTIWLYGNSERVIIDGITNGRNLVEGRQNKMPAWQGFLDEGKVHLLAAYVYSLSNK